MVVVVELSLPREVPREIKRVGPMSLTAASRHHKTAERLLYFLHLLSSAVCLRLSCLFLFFFLCHVLLVGCCTTARALYSRSVTGGFYYLQAPRLC